MSETSGEILGERLHAEHRPVLLARVLRHTDLTVTEIRSDTPTHEQSDPLPYDEAFVAALQLRDFPRHNWWEDGRPGIGIDDPVVRHLALALRPAFARPEQASRFVVDSVAMAVAAHVATTYGTAHATRRRSVGLSSRQQRRVFELIDARLGGDLTVGELARHCGLSSGHFGQAFKASTGMTPHRWLIARRVEKAKGLLRNSNHPLGQIALDCGFANQSHFTRVFTSLVGTPPGAWRKG